ncbi:MAG: hypothetical protein K9J16_15615 [Melioribacteraceae bacterium]|nr:hypothetical protein [Melioribacteraceae bacterium]MCF8354908.1 hypothetical protein [Melioribacteraceae bacterium]MCF8395233.1 hypothetical protein [Melioribacteraceae bacterium]MCF8420721.1 hypothetical protein [Melioribacteraceae bacterium]
MKKIILLVTVLLIVLLSCCKEPGTEPKPEPVPPTPTLKDSIWLSTGDVTHRSISLNVSHKLDTLNWKFSLYRIEETTPQLINSYSVKGKDTTIIDDKEGEGLQLETEYKYFALLLDSLNTPTDTTATITAQTLGATSHNYTWEEITIGDAGYSNTLYDVWGTDENNVWAVGGFNISGTNYGALHYNGTEWMPDSTVGGYAIYGFSADDIWVVGGAVFHYDGIKWNRLDRSNDVLDDNSEYTSVWGTSSDNVYLGNIYGKIIHWDGEKASVLYELSDVGIHDIDGNDEKNIWVASNNSSVGKVILANYNGTSWKEITEIYPHFLYPLLTVNVINKKSILVGGNGVHAYDGTNWIDMGIIRNERLEKLRGDASNNVFAVGHYGAVFHYNGIDWQFYDEVYDPAGGILESVRVIGEKVYAVGIVSSHNKARILIGTNY